MVGMINALCELSFFLVVNVLLQLSFPFVEENLLGGIALAHRSGGDKEHADKTHEYQPDKDEAGLVITGYNLPSHDSKGRRALHVQRSEVLPFGDKGDKYQKLVVFLHADVNKNKKAPAPQYAGRRTRNSEVFLMRTEFNAVKNPVKRCFTCSKRGFL